MPPYCSCGDIQVSISPEIQIRLQTSSFTPCFKYKCLLLSSSFTFARRHRKHPPTLHTSAGSRARVSITPSGSGFSGLKLGVNDAISCQIWMSGFTDTWMKPCEQYLILLDLAATTYTPTYTPTPKVFCGLHHPSIGIVVSRWGVNFHFSVNYLRLQLVCIVMNARLHKQKLLPWHDMWWQWITDSMPLPVL